MKRVLTAAMLTLGLTTVLSLAGGGASSVTTNSMKIADSPGRRSRQDWVASTAYTNQGEVIKAGSVYYFAETTGTTSTVQPSGRGDVTDGTVVWRHALGDSRSGLSIANEGSTQITVSWGQPAVSGTGILLAGGAMVIWSGKDTPQVPVYAVSASGTNSVHIYEW